MAVTSRHNKYTSIPDWFSGQSTETATTSSSVSQTVYISGSSSSTTTDSTVDFKDIPIDASTIVWQNELLTVPIDNDKIIIVDGKVTTSLNSDGVWELRLLADGTNYIYTTYPVVTQLGITMYSGTEGLDIGGIYDGLPIDNNTIYWDIDSDGNRVLKATGSSGGGVADSVAWSNIEGKPSWLLDNKISYSEIEGTPDLSKYALVSQIPSLEGYALSSDLAKYIPISGYTDITGEKNFTGGLKVNGSPIYYDTEKKYWKLEGDLLVTGGVTMYGNDSDFVASTIMDAILYDNTTLGINAQGQLYVKGSVGGATTLGSLANVGSWADSVAPQDRIMYQAANSSQWIAKNLSDLAVGGVTGDYLPSSGGTITNTLTIDNSTVGLILHRSGKATPYIRFGQDANNEWGELGVYNDGRLVFWPLVSSQGGYGQWNTVWHAGNDGGGSGLDADMLDGKHYSDIVNGNVASATKLQTARTIWGQSFDGTGNVDGALSTAHNNLFISADGGNTQLLGYSQKDGYYSLGYSAGVKGITTHIYGWEVDIYGGTTKVISVGANGLVGFYTNNQWLSPSKIMIGRANTQVFSDWASIGVTDGNLHLDSYNGKSVYINYYSNSNSQGLVVGGGILTTGGLTMYSDARKKTILNHVELSLKQIAEAPLIEHYYNSDTNKTTHVGSIAQYWYGLNDWFCKEDNEGFLTMEIQNCALASAISIARELVKFETETDRRIRLLEEENKRLKEEVEQLKWNIA